RLPCFKDRITEAVLFRQRPPLGSILSQNRSDVYELSNFANNAKIPRKILIGHGIGIALEVYADEFTPSPADTVSYVWQTSRGTIRLDMPHYCLTNLEQVRENACCYARKLYDERTYFAELISSHPLIAMTATKALEYASDSLLAKTLLLWSSTRLIESQRSICGPDTLGISAVSDPESPRFGVTPIIPIMDTQLDQIIIQEILEPLRSDILSALDKLVEQHRPETFFESYLTVFILLCSIERNTIAQERFARRHRVGRRFSNPPLLETYFHAARIFIAHFHFVCHGSEAIQSDWTSRDIANMANLSPDQLQFMEDTRKLVNEIGSNLTELREKNHYEAPLYWCHQLFFPNWTPGGPLHIRDALP
ncbi:hypothetical protein GQ53DRAFT_863880, partial [Thozetella sp. PMI_491]